MPYHWSKFPDPEARPAQRPAQNHGDELVAELHLWPHRSLPAKGFVWVFTTSAIGLMIPLLAMVGSGVMWGLLPFALVVIWALWIAIERNSRNARITRETLRLSSDVLTVLRQEPGQQDRLWRTNPYWVRSQLREDGPVEHYLTLTDGQREIEIGRFLSPQEREALRADIDRALARSR